MKNRDARGESPYVRDYKVVGVRDAKLATSYKGNRDEDCPGLPRSTPFRLRSRLRRPWGIVSQKKPLRRAGPALPRQPGGRVDHPGGSRPFHAQPAGGSPWRCCAISMPTRPPRSRRTSSGFVGRSCGRRSRPIAAVRPPVRPRFRVAPHAHARRRAASRQSGQAAAGAGAGRDVPGASCGVGGLGGGMRQRSVPWRQRHAGVLHSV